MNISIEELVVNKLIDLDYHIACAESCTGGLVCANIVNVPNASSVLNASFITYAHEAKYKYLNVSEELVTKLGVVSEEVAGQMALGVAKETGAEVGISTSGIAGPTGGTATKPVGMVCFGIAIKGKVTTYTHIFENMGRNEVRSSAVEFLLAKLLEVLE